MVLDAGRMVEFASPAELLQNGDGLFSKLVNGSADKETLRAMAHA
jgi:ABC-type multidrug transport system fused ATPase/permease subunit